MTAFKKYISVIGICLLLGSCDPFVGEFTSEDQPIVFTASNITGASDGPYDGGGIKVLTWNIRFGSGRMAFFGDSCGDAVISTNENISSTLEAIADTINQIDADIVFLQEVDIESKRTGYWDQMQFLLDNTYLNYGLYASIWQADYIPVDGLGRVNMGNAILSRYELKDGERIQLSLRGDQSSLVRHFYIRRNILKAQIPYFTTESRAFYAVNIHATAFATDDTKERHINKYLEVLEEINSKGDVFITGGDLNAVPPGANTDYCIIDMCPGESYHTNESEKFHKEGSYFNNFPGESDILAPLFEQFRSAIKLSDTNNPIHFTHAPSTSTLQGGGINRHDRKLDYLFTNRFWEDGLSYTHQGAWQLSDHMPVSGVFKPASY